MTSSPPPAPSSCASCGAAVTGRFCTDCGAPAAGARCGGCGGDLSPGSRFCHRCGLAAGAAPAAQASDGGTTASALPWAVAAIALVALIALVAGQRFGRPPADAQPPAAATQAAGGGRAPDISNMSPTERAIRLYDRAMTNFSEGKLDSAQFFADMAVQAYEAIGTLDTDGHYDVGRMQELLGDPSAVVSRADSILSREPTHLLGLVLAANAARMRGDTTAERAALRRFQAAERDELARRRPEYELHENDIIATRQEALRQLGGGR
jgi:hypothetical protein